ncbi:hypothetical protein BDV11DRAFT_209608 [Aspergillus similis]
MVHPRRPHRKSRRGCIECQRRHVNPLCANCRISKRHCSYEELVSKAPLKSRAPKGTDGTPVHSQSSRSNAPGIGDESPPVNKLHLDLFHHFLTDILTFFGFEKLSNNEFSTLESTKVILATPFLVNQILAFAALHLSILRPPQQQFYRHRAAQLQTHALSEYNEAGLDVTLDNTCVPMFLFSSILALHRLCEKLIFLTSESWHLLLESPLKSLLEVEGNALDHNVSEHECSLLMSRIRTSSLDPAVKDVYEQTIDCLQKAINGSRMHSSKLSTVGPILSWPVIIPDGYIDLLSHRRPEALVILSHFGALLHLHRDIWTFGDGGITSPVIRRY